MIRLSHTHHPYFIVWPYYIEWPGEMQQARFAGIFLLSPHGKAQHDKGHDRRADRPYLNTYCRADG
jgi:hypothetical protein